MVAQRLAGALGLVSVKNCSEALAPASGGKHNVPTQQLLISPTDRESSPGLQAGRSTTCCLRIPRNRCQLGDRLLAWRILSDSSRAETPWALIWPPNQGAASIKQVVAPLAMAWAAAATPPRDPPMTTTWHSQNSPNSGRGSRWGRPLKSRGWGIALGVSTGVMAPQVSAEEVGDHRDAINPAIAPTPNITAARPDRLRHRIRRRACLRSPFTPTP